MAAKYALAADRPPAASAPASPRRLYVALAAAFLLHLGVLLFFIVRPSGSERRLGVEEGLPDTLNVSVISAADLKRLSSDPFHQYGLPAATEQTPAPMTAWQPFPQLEPPTPHEAEASESPPNPKKSERNFDPSNFIAMASEQFSSQLKQAFKAAETRREAEKSHAAQRPSQAAANVRLYRPGASHSGKSNEFERAVIWALAATRPMGNGKWGSTIVTFVISAEGHVEGLRLLQSSGDNWLDTGAMMAVRQAHMPVPPAGLTAGDRTFVIEYISLPGR